MKKGKNKNWKNKLYRFQRRGVRFVERRGGKAIIADDMGLGKTIQAVHWIERNPKLKPVAIVCPSSVKIQWRRELAIEGIDSEVLSGMTPYGIEKEVVILNYTIAKNWVDALLDWGVKTLISDEFHFIKNRASKRSRACQQIGKSCENLLLLSGTPIKNRPDEYFPALNLVAGDDYDEFKSFLLYGMRYCDLKKAEYGAGYDTTGATNLDELHKRASKYMIRRMKKEVMKELPKKVYTVLPVEIDNREEYSEAQLRTMDWIAQNPKIDKKNSVKALELINQLRRIAPKGKIETVKEWINDWLDSNDEKLVVFAVHHQIVDALRDAFSDIAVSVDGRVKVGDERQAVVDDFVNNKQKRIFITTIETGGVGLDSLQRVSDTAIFVELAWTPSQHDQAEDRLLRIGQDSSNCFYYYFIAENTVEERNLELLQRKADVIDKVVDGKVDKNSMLKKMIDDLKKK